MSRIRSVACDSRRSGGAKYKYAFIGRRYREDVGLGRRILRLTETLGSNDTNRIYSDVNTVEKKKC